MSDCIIPVSAAPLISHSKGEYNETKHISVPDAGPHVQL